MPYIKPEERPQYKVHVDMLTDAMYDAGHLNYVIFAAVKAYLNRTNASSKSYEKIRDLRAELRECHDEIGRRILAEYEDSKILENGDVV
jgi:predicted transcriptional regulator